MKPPEHPKLHRLFSLDRECSEKLTEKLRGSTRLRLWADMSEEEREELRQLYEKRAKA